MNPITRAIAKGIVVIALAAAGAIGSYAASLSRTATAYAELADAVNGLQKEAAKQSERVAKIEGYIEAVKARPAAAPTGYGSGGRGHGIAVAPPPPLPPPPSSKFSPKQMPNRLDELLLESKK